MGVGGVWSSRGQIKVRLICVAQGWILVYDRVAVKTSYYSNAFDGGDSFVSGQESFKAQTHNLRQTMQIYKVKSHLLEKKANKELFSQTTQH